MAVAPEPLVLRLSLLLGGDLAGAAGGRLGRVDDLVVRLGEAEYPPVTGLLARIAGRDVFVPGDGIGELAHGRARLTTDRLDLRPFERRCSSSKRIVATRSCRCSETCNNGASGPCSGTTRRRPAA